MKYFLIVILSIFVFKNSFAKETVFTCEPIYAAVQTEKGTLYEETLKNMDEEAGLLSVVPTSNFSVRENGFFYRNNPSRMYEILRTYDQIISDTEISPKIISVIKEIDDVSKELDKKLGVENFKIFYLPYFNYSQEGKLLSSSLKRISIDVENYFTSEITIPSQAEDGVNLYYFLRKCDGKGIEVDFEPAFNKALS